MSRPVQEYYPPRLRVCFGCGPDHPRGLHIQTLWQDGEGVCRFRPAPDCHGYPGMAYGGLIACLIDCHSVGTATAATYEAEGRTPGSSPPVLYVTGTLKVRYLRPTPLDTELILRARCREISGRKATVECSVWAGEVECARGEVVCLRVQETDLPQTGA
jgi:acyl-coenzyme A thioesterase PaaI-like protein